jgi:hypothetical protein
MSTLCLYLLFEPPRPEEICSIIATSFFGSATIDVQDTSPGRSPNNEGRNPKCQITCM